MYIFKKKKFKKNFKKKIQDFQIFPIKREKSSNKKKVFGLGALSP